MSIIEQIGLLPRAEERAEQRLVASAMRGDRAAFDTLTREHAKALRGFLVRRLNLEAAEDVLQETWVAAWAALPRFTSRSRFKAWLFGIAQHKIQDHYRAQGRTPTEPLADHANVPDTRQPDPYGAVDLKHAVRGALPFAGGAAAAAQITVAWLTALLVTAVFIVIVVTRAVHPPAKAPLPAAQAVPGGGCRPDLPTDQCR